MASLEPKEVELLTNTRKEILKKLKKINDIKKLSYFFSKCGLIKIDNKTKKVLLGTPNTFIEIQIKKIFSEQLNTVIKKILGEDFEIQITTFPEFQNISHPLIIDINQLFGKTKSKKNLSKQLKEQLTNKIGILFEKKYKFDNFVVNKTNQIAFQSAKKVAQKPGELINPLFIRGNVGLGKTHLLQAIGNYIINKYPSKVIVYLPTTKFIDEVLQGFKKNNINSFFEKINQVDILILDDIQFLGEKLKTQEIFHNIFNDLYAKGKQIILSSDRPPKELNLIESRLTSRFAMGMVAKIDYPDFQLKKQIINIKLLEEKKQLDETYIDMIANQPVNIRELIGILNTIWIKYEILGIIDEKTISETIKELGINIQNDKDNFNSQIQKYLEIIFDKYNTNLEELKSKNRKTNVIKARAEFSYIAKNKLGWTLQKIGNFLGGKNHATILHYLKIYGNIKK